MKEIALDTINHALRIFYRNEGFPYNIPFIRRPLYENIRSKYYNHFSKYYNYEQKIKVKINKDINWEMYCRGDKGSAELELIIGGIYEIRNTEFILKQAKDCEIFIDIGANVGYYSILASKLSEGKNRVLAFEPVIETFKKLEKNIKYNKLNNVSIFNIGLGSKCENKRLKLKNQLGHNSLVNDDSNLNGQIDIIKMNKLDDVIGIEGRKVFIKLDTEGYEYEALKGAVNVLNNNECTILFEYTPRFLEKIAQGDALGFLLFLSNMGFDIFSLKRNLIKIDQLESFSKSLAYQTDLIAIKK